MTQYTSPYRRCSHHALSISWVGMKSCFGITLRCWGSSPSLAHLHLSMLYMSIGRIRKFIDKIPRIDVIFMGYWMLVQVRTMRNIAMCKNKLRIWDMDLKRILMIPCEMFLRTHLISTSIIDLLVSSMGKFYGLGNTLWMFCYSPRPFTGPTPLSRYLGWTEIWRLGHHLGNWFTVGHPWSP